VSPRSAKAGARLRQANRIRRLAYHAYGLAITSDVEIPELPSLRDLRNAGRDRVNLRILGPHRAIAEPPRWLNASAYADGTPWLSSAKIDGGYLLRFPKMADFVIDGTGHEITCVETADGMTEVTLRHLAIDHVMPRVLNLLGIESLHATAVAAPGGACAFIGDAGTGKSTLAASFHLNGMHTFCDDCLVLRDAGGSIMAMPAYPGVRLWDDSLKALMADADRGQPVAQYTSKTRLLGDAATFRADSMPLARIYFLQRPTEEDATVTSPAVSRIAAAAAFPMLVGASFPLDLTDYGMLARHFRFIVRVAATVPLRRLVIPNDFSALAAVRDAVIADLVAQ
jgi:hypothetical protein